MARISVVIPTHNRCESLKNAIRSVIAQTYKDFEILIVDDASTDNTQSYASALKNKNIYYIRLNTNKGGCHARNEGIKKSSGELIAFLDDDDLWFPKKLEKQIKLFSSYNLDFCFSAKKVIYSNSKKCRVSALKPKFVDPYKSIMYDNYIGTTSTILLRKKLIEQINGFDEQLPALQDYDLYIRLLENGCKIKGIYDALITYNISYEKNNVSCSFDNFSRASAILHKKYKDKHYYSLLKKALRRIGIKKAMKSRRYFLEMASRYFKF